MFPGSFAACVPVFMATPTSLEQEGAGASLVPCRYGHQAFPFACSANEAHIVFGAWLQQKWEISYTGLEKRLRPAVRGLSPVIIMVANPMARQMIETRFHAAFDDVRRRSPPKHAAVFATSSGVPPAFEMSRTQTALRRNAVAALRQAGNGQCSFPHFAAVKSTRSWFGGEGMKVPA